MLDLIAVSGLARGIDTFVHENSSKTVAVLGNGLEEVYPPENTLLAERIVSDGGSLISQFPMSQAPLPHNFPIRNELIAALALGTIVIEGPPQSGAMITGKIALEMNKTCIALTQDYRTAFGKGAIHLQQAGATLVSSEEEALPLIYQRVGGLPRSIPSMKSKRNFNLMAFQKQTKASVTKTIILLEQAILRGEVERIGPDLYAYRNRIPSARP